MRRAALFATIAACSSTAVQDHSDGSVVVDVPAGASDGAPVSMDGAALVDAALFADGPAADASSADIALWHQRADAAIQNMLMRYWTQSTDYLAWESPTNNTSTGYWTFAQAFDAILDGVERSGNTKFWGWAEGMYDAQNAIGWSRTFYDDENWMALALIRAYDLEGQAKYLTEAKALYSDIEGGWDTTCCGATPGGIWWNKAHTQKATAANAGPVITGVRLAARTGDNSYLIFAEQAYSFWRANMVNPTTYAVTDDIGSDGTLHKYRYTYNEGLMIGAAVALYGATGEPSYLDDAHHIAGYLLSAETESTVDGDVLFDGSNGKCGNDCEQFKGIAARYVKTLYDADPSHTEYAALLSSNANALYDLARDPDTGLFATDWAGPPVTSSLLNAESSAAMAISQYASMLGPEPATTDRQYEAEDGTLHSLGLERTHGGYHGWGYVAGWGSDGEWVDFHVPVAAAGAYTVTLRYASEAAASRLIYVNGANAVVNQAFAATGSYDTWATLEVPVELAAGSNTISVIYNSSDGSTGFVNLDGIVVTQ